MSPTKASLARFNPNLLSQNAKTNSSRSRPVSSNGLAGNNQDLRSYVLDVTPGIDDESPVRQATQRKKNASTRELTLPLELELESHDKQNVEPRETISSPSRPQPLAPSTRDNIISPPEPDQDEADLPATPQGLENIEYDPPPRGILFSSPSKRGRRPKSTAQKLKSSPLKPVGQQLSVPRIEDSQLSSPTRRLMPDSQNVDVVLPADPVVQDPNTGKADKMSNDLKQKIGKRDKMKSELKDLTKDINDLEAIITALDNRSSKGVHQDVDLENLV